MIGMENKNAAVCECANTHRPAQVLIPPTQRPFGRTAWNIIRHSDPFRKGRVLSLYFCVCVA